MNVILKIAFDSIINSEFNVINPPVLPAEGEIVSFQWEHFLSDKEDVVKLEEYEEEHILIANILCKKYYKDEIIVRVILFEEENYRQLTNESSHLFNQQ